MWESPLRRGVERLLIRLLTAVMYYENTSDRC